MDLYHVWCDLKPGVRDTVLVEATQSYLERLRSEGKIARWRLTRRKLGLGPSHLGEFHIIIETNNLAQLEQAFQHVSARAEPIEELHHGLNSLVQNASFALYRDFPDAQRKYGEEKF
jgi:hypothetical protein